MRNRFFCIAISLILSTQVQAQFRDSLLIDKARERIAALAAPAMKGRGYQEEGHLLAAEYIAGKFAEIGLKPIIKQDLTPNLSIQSFLQTFPMEVNIVRYASLSLDGLLLEAGKDFIVHAISGSGTGTLQLEDAGYGLMGSQRFSGKAVLFRDGWPADWTEKEQSGFASLKTTAARLEELMTYNPRMILIAKDKLTAGLAPLKASIPIIELQSGLINEAVSEIRFNVKTQVINIHSNNVCGWIYGNNRDKTFIISAHYDHLGAYSDIFFPGANDNASGVALLLAMAEHYRQPENAPECNLLFIAFGGEEAGLLGSRYFVEQAPLVELRQIPFVLNLDLMGNGGDGITVVGGVEYPDLLNKLIHENEKLQAVKKIYARRNAPNSDHYPFFLKGIPSFFVYTMGGPRHYHDIFDTYQNLELPKMEEIYRLLIAFLDTLQQG